jgi:hypothetical protein
MEDWLKNNLLLDDADVRLFAFSLRRCFAGKQDGEIVSLLANQMRRNCSTAKNDCKTWVQGWDPVFAQLGKEAIPGTTSFQCFSVMSDPASGLDGPALLTFWWNLLGRTGRSEIIVQCISLLITGPAPLDGRQVAALLLMLKNDPVVGTRPISLTKEESLKVLTDLTGGALQPTYIDALVRYVQTNASTNVVSAANAKKEFLRFCAEFRGSGLSGIELNTLVTGHLHLTDPQFSVLLLLVPLRYLYDLFNVPCVASPAVALTPAPGPTPATCGSVLAYAITRCAHNRVQDLAVFLKAAADADATGTAAPVPAANLFYLLQFLRDMTAGDSVDRLTSLVTGARKGRFAGKRRHSWASVFTLIHQFVTDNRRTLGPTNVPVTTAVTTNNIHCTGERFTYFFKAHTYAYCDFKLVNRSAADITFFSPGTVTYLAMQGLVQGACLSVPTGDVDDAISGSKMAVEHYTYSGHDYELGLVKDNAVRTRAALLHFMPFTVDPADYYHKDLLTAIGFLF